jgi:hypothetical protein
MSAPRVVFAIENIILENHHGGVDRGQRAEDRGQEYRGQIRNIGVRYATGGAAVPPVAYLTPIFLTPVFRVDPPGAAP